MPDPTLAVLAFAIPRHPVLKIHTPHPLRYTHALLRPNVIFTAANYDILGSVSPGHTHDLPHAAVRPPCRDP